MRVLVSGATGLIGSALAALLSREGATVVRLVRHDPPKNDEISWKPNEGSIDRESLEGFDAVVHLAGESIAGGRWTEEKKRRIYESRIKGTRLLAETLRGLSKPPGVLVSASGVNYYGNRGAELLREDSSPGAQFLSKVCRDWEDAALSAASGGIRVVPLRTGMVLSAQGGALRQMLSAFRLGLGGRIGSGKQYISWITLDDHVRVISHILGNAALDGPVNSVSPNPVTNREFTDTLGRVLSRPTVIPLPAFAVRLMFGEMGEELLLSGARVEPARLTQAGFRFEHPDVEEALRYTLGRDRR